jgi:hypothetical protein
MVLQSYIGKLVVIYFDDILVFSKNIGGHLQFFKIILDVLRKIKLYVNLKKYKFLQESLVFIGFIISTKRAKMDLYKVYVILARPSPRRITKVKCFHGMAIFYQKFIQNFSSTIASIIDCTKGKAFMLTNEAKESFKILKNKVIEALILALLYFDKMFEVDYDSSHLDIGAILSQAGRPITFFSKKLKEVQNNYCRYDVEFMQLYKHCNIGGIIYNRRSLSYLKIKLT